MSINIFCFISAETKNFYEHKHASQVRSEDICDGHDISYACDRK